MSTAVLELDSRPFGVRRATMSAGQESRGNFSGASYDPLRQVGVMDRYTLVCASHSPDENGDEQPDDDEE